MKKLTHTLSLCAVAVGAALASRAAIAQDTPPIVDVDIKACVGSPLRVVALTDDQRLLCFSEKYPYAPSVIGSLAGLFIDTRLIGIDYRRTDGRFYGVGNAGGIYTLNASNAVATRVNQLTVPLTGTEFGVDFNPVSGALRVVSDTGQNLRHSFATNTTTADATLSYGTGAAQGVGGAAYTNNDPSSGVGAGTGTTLFVLDAALDSIAIQAPPNIGTLGTAGPLAVNVSGPVGFDIFSQETSGIAVTNLAYASLPIAIDPRVGFYKIDLLTGKATLVAKFLERDKVVDIALPLDRNLPEDSKLILPPYPSN